MHVSHLNLGTTISLLPLVIDDPVDLHDVRRSDHRLLLAWVRDLRDRWDGPLTWRLRPIGGLDAPIVAVTNGENNRMTCVCGPPVTRPCLHRERLIHEDPATSTRTFLAEGLCGHEVVGGFHANADVLFVSPLRHLDASPELLALSIVLRLVKLLDVALLHVLHAVVGSTWRERSQGKRKGIDDRGRNLREEMLELSDPLHTDEASADDQHIRFFPH